MVFDIAALENTAKEIASELPNQQDLTNISDLANRQIRLENLLTILEDLTDQAKDALKYVSQKALPEALLNSNISEFKLEDGTRITVKKNYYPSIKDEDKPEAYSWLVQHGHDIIKNEVKVNFTKGQSEEATKALEALQKLGFEPSRNETIHWQTFRAWAKEISEKGLQVTDLINIHIVDEATIKRVK